MGRRSKRLRWNADSLQAVYCISPSNLGDMQSTPALHFVFYRGEREVPVTHMHPRWQEHKARSKPTIIGGGGLFKRGYDLHHWIEVASVAVAWGVGLNGGLDQRYPDWFRENDKLLIGVRDVNDQGLRWIPCVSCLSPLIDEAAAIRPMHRVVVYEAFRDIKCDPSIPRLKHWGRRSFERVLRFLASGETVVSASYHAAYWATLMGRRVAILPEKRSPKFLRTPWNWPIGTSVAELAGQAVENPGSLEECRAMNLAFAKDVERFTGLRLELFRQ